MADIVSEVATILNVNLLHLGAVAPDGTDLTLGMAASAGILFGLAVTLFHRIKRG